MKNEIICQFNIKNKDNIQILNCYEEVKRNKLDWLILNGIEGIENEKEIKENIEIYLNDEKIDFCYKTKFEKEGENVIKIIFNNPLKSLNFLFYDCSSLSTINLSNFHNNQITDMSYMFYKCSSLISLNISNFNTNNVNNIYEMFSYCSSLTSLNLSNFNTNNVNNMSYMFSGVNKEKCKKRKLEKSKKKIIIIQKK